MVLCGSKPPVNQNPVQLYRASAPLNKKSLFTYPRILAVLPSVQTSSLMGLPTYFRRAARQEGLGGH
jgi:hypothetical protein